MSYASDRGVTDEYGLTYPNQFLDLFFPATGQSIVLYVRNRQNPVASLFNWGPLPTTTSTAFTVYNGEGGGFGGSAFPTVAGTIPAAGWFKGMQFGIPPAPNGSTWAPNVNVQGTFPSGNNDVWYTLSANRLFEVLQYVTPAWLRVSMDIPTGQNQQILQQTVAGGVDQDFGWKRGTWYGVHIPGIHYGYEYGNDTNVQVMSRIFFRYAEQFVAVVTEPRIVFEVINNAIPNHKVYMPVVSNQDAVAAPLMAAYGYTGVPVYPRSMREQALPQYKNILDQAKQNLANSGVLYF